MDLNETDSKDNPPRAATIKRLKRILVRLSLIGAAILVALGLGEVAVRVTKPQVLFPRYVTAAPFGIRVNVPNARYTHRSPEMVAEFRINSMGIRSDREYTFEKPAGVIRIVGVGDSFTQGYEVNVEETYLYLLEKMLRGRGHNVEVINLGVSGHGTAEELIMLREFGFRFDPDIVIVGYFVNDLADNVRSNLFRLDENGELVRASETYLPAVGIRDQLYSYWAYRKLSEHSHLFALVRERMASMVKKRMERENLPPVVHESGADDYALRLTAALLDRMKLDCEERAHPLLVLDIAPTTLADSEMLSKYPRAIREADIVRTAAALQNEKGTGQLHRMQGHYHWTPKGHEVAAGLLSDRIEQVLISAP